MTTLVSPVRLSKEGPVVSRLVWGMMRLCDWRLSRSELATRIAECVELGITTYDHAAIYGHGECERLFGLALADMPGLRDQIQIVTKCGIRTRAGERAVKIYDTSRRYILESVESSLRRLRTDRLDLLLIHRPDPLMDADDVAEALSALRRTGKILHAGVSNFRRDPFELLRSRLDFALVTNQIEASVLRLDAFYDGTVDLCQMHRIRPMAWGPVGGGGLYSDRSAAGLRVRDAVAGIGKELGERSLQDIALAWLFSHPGRNGARIGHWQARSPQRSRFLLRSPVVEGAVVRHLAGLCGAELP